MTPAQAVDDIYNAHNNQPWEVEDSSNLDQCFDEVLGYCDTLGIPRDAIRHLYAYQIFTTPNALTYQFFDIIPNSASLVPQKGDIGVYGTTIGPSGHTCVELGGGNTQTHQSFDQNWDTAHYHDGNGNPICRIVTHTYNGFLGVLRPRNQGQPNNQGGDMPATEDQIKYLYHTGTGRLAMDSDVSANLGKDVGALVDALRTSKESLDFRDKQTSYAYRGFLRRDPEPEATVNARDVAILEFEANVENSPEAATVTATFASASGSAQQIKDANAQIDALKIKLGQQIQTDPNSIVITQKGWSALFTAIKSFFVSNN